MIPGFSEDKIEELLATKITPFYKLKDQTMIDELYQLKKKLNEENNTTKLEFDKLIKQKTGDISIINKKNLNLLKKSIDELNKP
jgi:hypothetical protein